MKPARTPIVCFLFLCAVSELGPCPLEGAAAEAIQSEYDASTLEKLRAEFSKVEPFLPRAKPYFEKQGVSGVDAREVFVERSIYDPDNAREAVLIAAGSYCLERKKSFAVELPTLRRTQGVFYAGYMPKEERWGILYQMVGGGDGPLKLRALWLEVRHQRIVPEIVILKDENIDDWATVQTSVSHGQFFVIASRDHKPYNLGLAERQFVRTTGKWRIAGGRWWKMSYHWDELPISVWKGPPKPPY